MNIEKLKRAWYPLYPSQKLGRKPIATELLGQKLALARLNGKVVCYDDCCPHRHVPLSDGKIVGDTLQCCYHGWQFDISGSLKYATGNLCNCDNSNIRVPTFPCCEYADWVWVCLTENIPFAPYPNFETPEHFDTLNASKTIEGDFIHAIENFLDPTHTPFIHAGLLRTRGKQSMNIRQWHDDSSFTTEYTLHQQQNGLINRLFDQGITLNLAQFHFPALASIDYLTPHNLVYRIAIFFIPKSKGKIGMNVRVSLPKTRIPITLKHIILRPFLESLLWQDSGIIKKQYQHHQHYSQRKYISTFNDLVIDHLLYLLVENMPEGVDKSGEMVL